jgi:hypothetical protein
LLAGTLHEAGERLSAGETADVLADGVHALPGCRDTSRRISLADAAALRPQLAERFDGLELHLRQQFVRSLLVVTVHRGRSAERFVIERQDPHRPGAVLALPVVREGQDVDLAGLDWQDAERPLTAD